MADIEKLCGIIIRESLYGENDKLLEIFTKEYGIVSVLAKGARKHTGKLGRFCHILLYGEFTVYRKGNMMWLREVSPAHDFYGVDIPLDVLSLINYFVEIIRFIAFTEDTEIYLRLFLNTLYFLRSGVLSKTDKIKVKAAFEMKISSVLGFAPCLDSCSYCGKKNIVCYDTDEDSAICGDCMKLLEEKHKQEESRYGEEKVYKIFPLTPSCVMAVNYIAGSDIKRIFFFSIDEKDMNILSDFTENYLMEKTEHRYKSLDAFRMYLN